jgi:phytanoyl-CoA hydroxylase
MLFSATGDNIVNEAVADHGIVDLELKPGDVSIHHPHSLHYSEPNHSPQRRCGLDIGYISAATRIRSEGLYLDPILVRGKAVPGVNQYRALPRYASEESIPFAGHEEWNKRPGVEQSGATSGEAPIDTTKRMIKRLREGSVAR